MPLVLWVPARRLASCQLTTRARMSRRTGRPNTSSSSSMSPTSLLSRVRTVTLLNWALPRASLAAGAGFSGRFSTAPACCRNAAGNGSPSGILRLTASLTSTYPPLLPGTAPFSINSPRSVSADITSRLCMVTRAAPRWPAIFLFLKVLPGSWRCPVEPWLRCETETPWVARKPPKLCRFIPPAKPLPMLVPTTSTCCPARNAPR